MSKLFTGAGFVADEIFEYHDPKSGELRRVPIAYSKGAGMKKRTVETRDSATDELTERLVKRLNQQTTLMESLLDELERAREGGARPRRTYDAAARADTRRASEAEAGRDFEQAARHYHRKNFDPHTRPSQEPEPAQRRRTQDAEGESPEAQFEKGARRLREQMLERQQGKRKL